jgi:phospholipid/cholesterol/gamma-HCH transport system permease protein
MAQDPAADPPDFAVRDNDGLRRFALSGAWTLIASRRLEKQAASIVSQSRGARAVIIDASSLRGLDTAGAFALNRARDAVARAGATVTVEGARTEHQILLDEMRPPGAAPPPPPRGLLIFELLADLGASVFDALHEFYRGVGFLGEFVAALVRIARLPRQFRGTSLVYQLEHFGFRSIPIIVLINLAVGSIVAQQGIYQLTRFGAVTYAVDLIGILVLREMGVLLTSIMIAGRSGSAITAELGSMVMREEIDALHVMGMSPIDVLVVPRVLALIFALPLLTVVADLAALLGGGLVCWGYAGISPSGYLSLLKEAIAASTFFMGLIKAPFMALIIGLIATQDGLSTSGSAESLGRQVTSAVVKSIFSVIIADGLFAMFFSSIHYG